MKDAKYWIDKLAMKKHPEGGYYRETYRSEEIILSNCLPERYLGNRHYSTAIYFLIPERDFSAFRRLKTDEIWHFYAGCSLTLHLIDLAGKYWLVKLGQNWEQKETFQVVVKAGYWCSATLNNSASYALIGCTVAPGFDFQDFELGQREDLIKLYPNHRSIIEKLTRK
jgi:predicted cupin superfamily sugar epimerase